MSARQLSPSARARAHEKKLRDREMRRVEAQGPGPGAYDTSARAKTSGAAADGHASSFRSKTPRGGHRNGDTTLRDVTLDLDPGAYTPDESHCLSARAKQSFGKPGQAGKSNFGTHSKRTMRLDILGEGFTPCPTQYGGAKLSVSLRGGRRVRAVRCGGTKN